jgi:hypothetical protein
MFPFLNENNECEDFFHIIGEEGQVMGQLDLKFKFEKMGINSGFKYSFSDTNNLNKDYSIKKKNNNTISYPLNNVFEKNNKKNNFMKTGNEHDMLHKRLEEAMNSIDDLTQILKNKVEIEEKEKMKENNILNNNDVNINEEEMIQNNENENINGEEEYKENQNYNEEEEIHEQEYNEEEMEEGYEEQVENEENQYEENNEAIDNGNINNDINNNINNDINDNINNNINNNIDENLKNNLNNINNNNNNNIKNENNIEYENKTALTECNNLYNSQKMSINDEENDKASFYSETKEKDKKKMKYLKNYDKNLLNKIQKIMKNKK